MASKIELLKKLLAGDKARYKDPNERPTSQTQRRTYDVFQRAASSLYQQSLVGNAERMQRIRDYEEMDLSPEACVLGDTIIQTIEFGPVRIKNLCDIVKQKEIFHVYGYDLEKKSIVITKAWYPRKTKVEHTYKVIFDDDSYIVATEDHKFLTRDGKYVILKDLKENDSLMPFYRKNLGKTPYEHAINHKVKKIEYYGIEEVYDLSTETENFATDTVIVHNSKCLTIVADNSVLFNEFGDLLTITSDDEKIVAELEELFYERLDLEFHLWQWMRNVCKYGDNFLMLDISEDQGLLGVIGLPVSEIERIEGFDNDPNSVQFRWLSQGSTVFENYQISHMRILGDDRFLPYGKSMLDPVRKVWKQLIMMEDAMLLYRVTRASEKRIFYVDVGNIPPKDVEQYLLQVRDKMKRTPTIDESNGDISLRFNPECISLNTIIPLLDGRNLTIQEIINERCSGKVDQYVYSVDRKNNKLVPGKVIWAGVTRKNAEIVRVHLDDSSYIDTTPDHQFMLRNGEYCRAEDLSENDSLMPLYTKKEPIKKNSDSKMLYTKIYEPFAEKYETVHKIVANNIDELINQKSIKTNEIKNTCDNNLVVHHKNLDSFDNHPSNLQWMGNIEHCKYHASIGAENLRKYAKSEEHKQIVIKTNKEQKKAQHMGLMYNGTDLHKSHNTTRSQVKKQKWIENYEEYCKNMRYRISEGCLELANSLLKTNPFLNRGDFGSVLKSNIEFMDLFVKCNNHFTKKNLAKIHYDILVGYITKTSGFKSYTDYKTEVLGSEYIVNRYSGTKLKEKTYKNHKVVRIEKLLNLEDTGCITIETYHNFAILTAIKDDISKIKTNTSGIFINNSVLEDFFIATRGDRSSHIETLPGVDNVAAIDDINYMFNKFLLGLGVPKAYLAMDADVGSKSLLSQQDVNFARSIQRLQKMATSELAKMALIHLFLKGYEEDSLYNFDLKLTNPSQVMENMQLELIEKRFEIASKMTDSKLISNKYVQKEVLKLSNHEVAEISEDIINETKKKFLLTTIEQDGDQSQANQEMQGKSNQENFGDTEQPESSPHEEGPMDIPELIDKDDFGEIFKDAEISQEDEDILSNTIDRSDIIDKQVNDKKNSYDNLLNKRSKKKKGHDILNRTISDIMRHDKEMNKIFENLKSKKRLIVS